MTDPPEPQAEPPENEAQSQGETALPQPANPAQAAPFVARELRASDLGSAAYEPDYSRPRRLARPNLRLPIILLIATCLSTFWVGCADWKPLEHMQTTARMVQAVKTNWGQGLTYMGAVLGILLTHEMGHYLMTLRHRIQASYPLCIPVPFNPIGTMGAVIGMDGLKANRKEIFDIGLAGPLAGLAVAVPVLWYGVRLLDLSTPPLEGEIQLYNPVIVRWMIEWIHPQWIDRAQWTGISQVNAWFMAGWVGMLVTGLNMLPVSQLDGGHTIHGLFGRESHKIARAFTIVSILYVVIYLEQAAMWTLMLVLVILMGIHHPPTSDDTIELDDRRWLIGIASLSIPILCFPLLGLKT